LLLLDNFEQLMPAAPLLTDLLQASTAVTLLVTSRSPLHLRWEQEFAVSPLAVPPLTPPPPPATLVGIGSVALFVQRTQRVDPTFRLDEINARAVAEICVRLDGLTYRWPSSSRRRGHAYCRRSLCSIDSIIG
jgi:predicted ATPase